MKIIMFLFLLLMFNVTLAQEEAVVFDIARKGTVEIVIEEEVEKPVKRFSLYGED